MVFQERITWNPKLLTITVGMLGEKKKKKEKK